MRYEDFRREYDAVAASCASGRMTADRLRSSVGQLRDLLDHLSVPDAERASRDLAALDRLLNFTRAMPTPVTTPLLDQASQVFRTGMRDGGTTAERSARVEHALAELNQMADRAGDPRERAAIVAYLEPLTRLLSALRRSGR